MSDQLLIVERNEQVCTLSLNRREKHNSLNPEMLLELTNSLRALADEEEIRCVVLRGAGEDAFSAGFDIGRIGEEGGFQDWRLADPYQDAKEAIRSYPYPVIAMIHGYCVGGGLEMAVACDLRIAAQDARLGITPAKLGLAYADHSMAMFVDLVGPAYTKELFLTARLVTAQQALAMGLVNEVVPKEQLTEYTYGLAQQITANAPLSVRAAKRTVDYLIAFKGLSPDRQRELEELRRIAADSEDLKEGQRAFLEKRKPNFQGR